MHDFMVESIFPQKKPHSTDKTVSPRVRQAMKKAAERVKSFKHNFHSKSISTILKSRTKNPSVGGEIRDIIYFS